MDTFFSNFPIISYNGANTVDITRNVSIAANSYNNAYLFSDYTIEGGIRSDQLANKIYGDPYEEWLIFLSNQIIDPYKWHMNSDEFYDYVNQKYGDWYLAQQKVKYYLCNWYDNPVQLNPGDYEALIAASPNLSKYWQPFYGEYNQILGYNRTQVDWVIDTNHIVQINFNIPVPQFTLDEIVNIEYDVGISGNGQVCFTTNNALYFQHVRGNYFPSNYVNSTSFSVNAASFNIFGQESNNTITIANANNIASIILIDTFSSGVINLQSEEYTYYEPITYFDDENIKNENNKTIVYLNSSYVSSVTNQMKNLL